MRNTLISIFDGIKDPRKIDRCVYELGDLLAVAFLSYLSGPEDYADMSLFSVSRAREFGLFPYTDRNPSADTSERLFATLSTDITDPLGLKLKDSWNIEKLPHRGRHPNKYHEWVIDKMTKIVEMPEMMGLSLAGQQQFFIQQFDLQVIQPVKLNPEMLYKKYWQSLRECLDLN